MTPEVVKYKCGLLMAGRGMRNFDQLAARLDISKRRSLGDLLPPS